MFMKWLTENSFKRAAAVLSARRLYSQAAARCCQRKMPRKKLPEITPPQISKKPEYEVTTTTLENKVSSVGKIISLQEETMYFTIGDKRLKELNVRIGQKVTRGK